MAKYLTSPAHERLNVFFGEFFREMRKAPPQSYGMFLARAEQEFKRLGYRDAVGGGVENILIVRLDIIGDMVLTSGFIREVRANFPHARITLVVNPLVYPIVEFCPYVNEVLSVDINSFNRNFLIMLENIAVFCKNHLWQKKFSVAFSPRWHNDTLPALFMAWLSGARERIGYGSYPFHSWTGNPNSQVAALDNFLLTKNVVTPRNILTDIEKNYFLLTAAGYKVNQTYVELFYTAADIQRAKELLEPLPSACKKVMVGIGTSIYTKKYPVEKLTVALKQLAQKKLAFVIVGGQSELDDGIYLEKNLPPEKILNLVGKTSLRETEAIAAQMDYYIGNDTSALHMAAAAHVPVLGIYRGAIDRDNILPAILSEFHRFRPWQTKFVALRPKHPLGECATLPPTFGHCYHHREPHCITQITPQEVVAGFERLERMT